MAEVRVQGYPQRYSAKYQSNIEHITLNSIVSRYKTIGYKYKQISHTYVEYVLVQ